MEDMSQNVLDSSEDQDGMYNDGDKTNSHAETLTAWMNHIAWVFDPIRPIYNSVKYSSSFAENLISMTENWFYHFVAFLANIDFRSVLRSHVDQVPERSSFNIKEVRDSIDPLIKQLFKIWFEAHQNLLHFVDYIANLYEDIVPLLPGDEPWNNLNKKNLSIRNLCFKATVNMGDRLYGHSIKFLQRTISSDNQNAKA